MKEFLLHNMKIQNFKGIENLDLSFQKGVNLIIGNNGVGKTSISGALAVGLHGILTKVKGVRAKSISNNDLRIVYSNIGGASKGRSYQYPLALNYTISADGITYDCERYKDEKITKNNCAELSNLIEKNVNCNESILPVLCYLDDKRNILDKDSDPIKAMGMDSREKSYINSMDGAIDINTLYWWCMHMEMSAFQKGAVINEYENFKMLISRFLSYMNDSDNAEIYFSIPNSSLIYKENNLELPISLLSAGYQSIFQIVMNIAYRVAALNPFLSKEDISQVPGVAIIDELDLHLHPKWQWNIIGALEYTFPNIQFIATTHSPIVISSCKTENLIWIQDDGKADLLASGYGLNVSDILEYRQGANSQLKEVVNLKNRFEEYISVRKLNEAEECIAKLSTILGENHSEISNLQSRLEMAQWLGENI